MVVFKMVVFCLCLWILCWVLFPGGVGFCVCGWGMLLDQVAIGSGASGWDGVCVLLLLWFVLLVSGVVCKCRLFVMGGGLLVVWFVCIGLHVGGMCW